MFTIHRTLVAGALVLMTGVAAHAQLWGTAVTDPTDLTGSRTSTLGGGLTATQDWDDGGLTLMWDVYFDNSLNLWVYEYSTTVVSKGVSHLLLEVTDPEGEDIFEYVEELSSTPTEGPTTFTAGGSNPGLPYPIYAVKFDFGGEGTIQYTLVTNRAPVWGVFYTKDGKSGGVDLTAWSDALNHGDFKTNATLTKTDFIVRPDGVSTDIPEPAGAALLAVGAFAILRRRAAGCSE